MLLANPSRFARVRSCEAPATPARRPTPPGRPASAARRPYDGTARRCPRRSASNRPQDPRGGQGALGVHVAPPVHRLGAPQRAKAPMVAQHRAYLRVDAALDPVVGRRQGPVNRQLGVEEREQDAPSDQPQQAVARRHEPLAGPLPRAVVRRRALGEEALPAATHSSNEASHAAAASRSRTRRSALATP